jgi:hypothetical protein
VPRSEWVELYLYFLYMPSWGWQGQLYLIYHWTSQVQSFLTISALCYSFPCIWSIQQNRANLCTILSIYLSSPRHVSASNYVIIKGDISKLHKMCMNVTTKY